MCTWYSGLRGTDVITVPETDPLGGPGTYYAAVFTVEEGEVHFQARARSLSPELAPSSRGKASTRCGLG